MSLSTRTLYGLLVALLALTVSCAEIESPPTEEPELDEIEQLLSRLEQRKTQIQDIRQIKRVQHAYGYYIDRGLWDEAADLFAEDGSIEFALDGVYTGKQRVRDYLYALGGGQAGLAEGQLNEHMQLMPVVTVAADGKSAKGRFRGLVMAGKLGERALWGEGPYENEYVKERGVWKIKRLHWYQSFLVPYAGGWQTNQDVNGGKWIGAALAPDQPPTVAYATWPSAFLPPFHFSNPVTGKESGGSP